MKPPETAKPAATEGVATWYKVPTKSLTKERAGKDELTAAHNRLSFGTKVRVTHLGNGKNVVVRITDRGVYRRGVVIDLCKEAAEKLDMLREGSARVRLEILPDDKAFSKKKGPPW
jgi:rare lipoprotein A